MYISEEVIEKLSPEQHELYEIVGNEIYCELIDYFAGTTIYIPTKSSINKIQRNEEIVRMKRAGYSVAQISGKLNICQTAVRKIIRISNEESIHARMRELAHEAVWSGKTTQK